MNDLYILYFTLAGKDDRAGGLVKIGFFSVHLLFFLNSFKIRKSMDRRSFIRHTGLGAAAWSLANPLSATDFLEDRKFRISLKPDAIGVNMPIDELLPLAQKIGFEAVAVSSDWLLQMPEVQLSNLQSRMSDLGLTYGSAGMPLQFRETEKRFKNDLAALGKHAVVMRKAGITRVGTWIMPSHNELTYEENMDLHISRLRQAAKIYADNGIRLGLEYVGPKTLHDAARYGFIRTGRQLKRMIEEIDVAGVGVILDSFHWYTSGETAEHLKIWRNEDIVAVDLNDADKRLSKETQIDGNRELPGATGMIDLMTFVGYLKAVGYDGPVRAEPFNETLNAMDDQLAAQATYDSISRSI
ncbi:xylose isomerase [Lewinellaceae bacterium SD302]|nr:xylose isomerase [Lewinellaceae bacterium SD302]